MADSETRMDWLAKWTIIVGGAIIFAMALQGCNTVKGFAHDMHAVAEGIQNEMAKDDTP